MEDYKHLDELIESGRQIRKQHPGERHRRSGRFFSRLLNVGTPANATLFRYRRQRPSRSISPRLGLRKIVVRSFSPSSVRLQRGSVEFSLLSWHAVT